MTTRVAVSCPEAGDAWCLPHDVMLHSSNEASWACYTCATDHPIVITPSKWYELRLAGAMVA